MVKESSFGDTCSIFIDNNFNLFFVCIKANLKLSSGFNKKNYYDFIILRLNIVYKLIAYQCLVLI